MVSLNIYKNSANKFGRKMGFKIENEIEDQDQSIPKLIGILTHVFCIFGPNLVILAWTGDELSCRQAQNGVTFDFEVKSYLALNLRNSHLPYIRACLPGGHFWGYLTGTHSFIQATHLKIRYLIFHELQWLNKHERVTGWLSSKLATTSMSIFSPNTKRPLKFSHHCVVYTAS